MQRNNLSLYIHIPFCVKKCAYCDFLSFPCTRQIQEIYVSSLCREIKALADVYGKKSALTTIFIGGGTPSILELEQLRRIFETVYLCFSLEAGAEISIECNPGTVTKEKLAGYKKLGINRLSIGLQSTNNEELKRLGRIHTWEQFLETWKLVREIGFENVNIDLMSALPGQTLESWKETLERVISLKPEHISAYSLIVEEGTPFFERYGKEAEMLQQYGCHKKGFVPYENAALPEEDTERKMYVLTEAMLFEASYHRYEISNYAKAGYECRHNKHYWTVDNYLGAGIGAASYMDGWRWSNLREIENYCRVWQQEDTFANLEECQEEITHNSQEEQMEEMMFLGLRMMEGVSDKKFQEQFGKSIMDEYGKVVEKLIRQGLLIWREHRRLALTKAGIDVSNVVMAEFLH